MIDSASEPCRAAPVLSFPPPPLSPPSTRPLPPPPHSGLEPKKMTQTPPTRSVRVHPPMFILPPSLPPPMKPLPPLPSEIKPQSRGPGREPLRRPEGLSAGSSIPQAHLGSLPQDHCNTCGLDSPTLGPHTSRPADPSQAECSSITLSPIQLNPMIRALVASPFIKEYLASRCRSSNCDGGGDDDHHNVDQERESIETSTTRNAKRRPNEKLDRMRSNTIRYHALEFLLGPARNTKMVDGGGRDAEAEPHVKTRGFSFDLGRNGRMMQVNWRSGTRSSVSPDSAESSGKYRANGRKVHLQSHRAPACILTTTEANLAKLPSLLDPLDQVAFSVKTALSSQEIDRHLVTVVTQHHDMTSALASIALAELAAATVGPARYTLALGPNPQLAEKRKFQAVFPDTTSLEQLPHMHTARDLDSHIATVCENVIPQLKYSSSAPVTRKFLAELTRLTDSNADEQVFALTELQGSSVQGIRVPDSANDRGLGESSPPRAFRARKLKNWLQRSKRRLSLTPAHKACDEKVSFACESSNGSH